MITAELGQKPRGPLRRPALFVNVLLVDPAGPVVLRSISTGVLYALLCRARNADARRS